MPLALGQRSALGGPRLGADSLVAFVSSEARCISGKVPLASLQLGTLPNRRVCNRLSSDSLGKDLWWWWWSLQWGEEVTDRRTKRSPGRPAY